MQQSREPSGAHPDYPREDYHAEFATPCVWPRGSGLPAGDRKAPPVTGIEESVTVTAQSTFGRDGAMFESLLSVVAQLSTALWILVIVTAIIRFIGIRVYRHAARKAAETRSAQPAQTAAVPAAAATSVTVPLGTPANQRAEPASAAPMNRQAEPVIAAPMNRRAEPQTAAPVNRRAEPQTAAVLNRRAEPVSAAHRTKLPADSVEV